MDICADSRNRLARHRYLNSHDAPVESTGSEMDTDDEISAVMADQVRRAAAAGGSDVSANFSMETRQSAEGDVVTSPVPGDGGGGGDGSSGHSSEDDSGRGGSVLGGSHNAFDFPRGSGFSGSSTGGAGRQMGNPFAGNPFTEDNPEVDLVFKSLFFS